ncbi:Uma2 family endonuclease [Winogradskya consettensis]|uniref:Uma2 family endonuclease n=1 Tax=Winogradskya consettensis TaxID=113560 RepID=UPI001FD55C87|nr:Uma2 family endonuclease [Actinoplanes consettensis]
MAQLERPDVPPDVTNDAAGLGDDDTSIYVMGAEAVGNYFPATVTLDDLTVMNTADRYGHRYELSPEGVLSVMPPAGSLHAAIATQLTLWFGFAGWPGKQVYQGVGIRVSGPDGEGGRIPDLTLWARPLPDGIWFTIDGLLLAVEIVSPGSTTMDGATKLQEYAATGVPRYWIIDRDEAQTVSMHVLGPDRAYEVAEKVPFAELLRGAPGDYDLAWGAR